MVDQVIYQEHTYQIVKSGQGFGIAISGGRDNPAVQSGDPAIIISDVVVNGPAFNRLQIDDVVVRVNNQPTDGWTHQHAVKALKNSGNSVLLAVKRKTVVSVDPRRRTPSPGAMRRTRSRDFDDDRYSRRRRSYSPKRDRSRSRERRGGRHRSRSRGRGTSRSRSRSRRRSYSRSHSRSSRRSRGSRYRSPSSSRSPSPSPPRSRSRGRGSRPRSRTPDRASRRRSPSERTASSERSLSPVPRLTKQKSRGELRPLSPLSPDGPDTAHDPDAVVFAVRPPEAKPVILKKTRWNNAYGLKFGTRIFIQDIQPGSLAEKNPELKKGDSIMMINGRNVDNKTVDEAIQIIGLSKDKLTMLVKSESGGTVSIPASHFAQPSPSKSKHGDREKVKHADDESNYSHSSRSSSRSEESRKSERRSKKSDKPAPKEPEPEKKDRKAVGGVRVMPAELEAATKAKKPADTPPSSSSRTSSRVSHTPEPAPRVKSAQPLYDEPPEDEVEEDGQVLPANAHTIKFIKKRSVGIRLAGGNDVGIFVASVLDTSAAAAQGLKAGDQILSVNNKNFRNIIREEAVLALMGLPEGQEVTIVAQPRFAEFQKTLDHGTGDSFYIRTHFKYERANDHEMAFKQGSVFRISDTLYQGMVGYWLAVRIGKNNMELQRGVIPNGSRAQQLKEVQDKKIQQLKEKASQRGGIKRRLKGNAGKGKPEKSFQAPLNSPHFPAYERVVLREAGFKRPVTIFGPLADIARQRLASDYNANYEIANNDGIVSGQKSNRKGIIRLNTIKNIIEKDKHAILDITPAAVEKLNYAQLYPIVVFLKPESKAAVKELRSKLAVTEEERKKKHGKLYDRAVKLQKGYGHVFTDTISLEAVSDDWYRRLHSTIKDQQNMPVWVSEDKLGGSADDDDEPGMVSPGDDDGLSYVSAPGSEYSVTTVGSEFQHSATDFDDEDLEEVAALPARQPPAGGVALVPPPKRPPSSSSSDEEEAGNKFDDDDLDDALNNEEEEEPPHVKPMLPPAKQDYPSSASSPRGMDRSSRLQHDDESSTSSEEPRQPAPKVAPSYTLTKSSEALARAVQPMPDGRFDPDSFLKNHIKRLNKVRADPGPPPEAAEPPSPQPLPQPAITPQRAPEVESANRYQPEYRPEVRRDARPSEPLYAQVDKNRQPPKNTAGPYSPSHTKPYEDSYRKQTPTNTYNRFAGTASSSLPKSNPQAPRNNAYKGYNPRPYSKFNAPAPVAHIQENRPPKDSMYDSGVETHDKPKLNRPMESPPVSNNPDSDEPQVVATARGTFDSDGGVLSSVETGVSIMIPKGAIPPGVRQNIYFKVCKDNTVLPPLNTDRGETLLSPLVMCGPHGLQFNHPVELRLPHCASLTPDGWSFSLKSSDTSYPGEPSQWQNMNLPQDGGYQVNSNSVSVLIDHF